MKMKSFRQRKGRDRGVSLLIVALSLLVLLGVSGLAVDLATLYVARNEAQRAADAAALAGAGEFVSTNISTGLMTPSQAAPIAAAQAAQVGNQNRIIGRNPDLSATNFNDSCPPPTGVSGGCFNFSVTNDPRITVTVYKKMPTYFMRVFGVDSMPVSVTATAEAYTPEGSSGPSSSVQCLKPWLLPNCDYGAYDAGSTPGPEDNPDCKKLSANGSTTLGYYKYFVDPSTGAIVRPGLTPDGAVGELLTIKPGNPQASDVSAPSQFWPVFLPSDGTFTCPSCASSDQQNSTSNSAALYRENIECCSDTTITCGATTVDPISGDMVGPTGQGVDCLIHQGNNGSGQDYISLDSSLAVPFIMYAGANNPYSTSGSQITTSDSLVTLPLYDGEVLCPGNSCPTSVSVDVQGFLQLFVKDEGAPQNSVDAYVLSVSSCIGSTSQTGGTGTTTPIPSVSGTPIPVRLINGS